MLSDAITEEQRGDVPAVPAHGYVSKEERNKMSIICFDTETTGLTDEDEIVQLSIADVDGNEILNAYFRPSDHLMERRWDEPSSITGIYPEDVADCPSLSDPEIHDQIQAIFDAADIVIGYHVCYDVKMMEKAGFDMSRYIYQDPMYAFASYYWSTHPGEKHTKRNGKVVEPWCKWRNNGFGGKGIWVNRNLSDAARISCGITDFGAHDSMNDVYATIAVWHAMNKAQEDVYFRGFAYDEEGNPIVDANGDQVYIDENGNPMIDPNGYGFVYVYDYTCEQLKAID